MSILSLLGVTSAYAVTNTAPSTGQGFISMLPMFIILILFVYFLIIRPQSRRAKQQKELISSLKKGDEVVTGGGLLGKITKITDNFTMLEIAEGIEITMQKNAISASLPKGTMKSI